MASENIVEKCVYYLPSSARDEKNFTNFKSNLSLLKEFSVLELHIPFENVPGAKEEKRTKESFEEKFYEFLLPLLRNFLWSLINRDDFYWLFDIIYDSVVQF